MDQETKDQKQATIADFEVLCKLGKGSFGTVFKVKRKHDKKIYVIKQINISQLNKNMTAIALNEVQILSSLENPFIVKYFDSFIDKNYLNIVMEHCEGGDLANHLRGQLGKPLSENTILKFFIQMCIGLRYIHSKRILHRDMKSLNVFLTKEQEIRIGDLGVAKTMSAGSVNSAKKAVGTPYYLSPEICEEKPYNEKSDIWSLGCILYELCAQKHPFEASSYGTLVIKILRGKYEPIPVTYNSELSEIIELCLSKDYNKRPSADELLHRPIIISKARAFGLKLSFEEKTNGNQLLILKQQQQEFLAKNQPNQEEVSKKVELQNSKEMSPDMYKKKVEAKSELLRDKSAQRSSDQAKAKKDLPNNNLFQVYQNVKPTETNRVLAPIIKQQKEGMDYLKLLPNQATREGHKPIVKPQMTPRTPHQESPRKPGARPGASTSQLMDEKSFPNTSKLLENRSASCTNTAMEDYAKKAIAKSGRESPSARSASEEGKEQSLKVPVKARKLPTTPRNLESMNTTTTTKLAILDNAKRSLLLQPHPLPSKIGKASKGEEERQKFPAIKQQGIFSERDSKNQFQKTQYLQIEREDLEENLQPKRADSLNQTPRRLIIKTKKSDYPPPMNSPNRTISIKRPEPSQISREESKIDIVEQTQDKEKIYTELSKNLEKENFYASIIQKNEKAVNDKKRNQLQQLMKERAQYFIDKWGDKAFNELTNFLRIKIDKNGEKAEIGVEEFLNDKLKNKVEPEQIFYIVNKILPIEDDLEKLNFKN